MTKQAALNSLDIHRVGPLVEEEGIGVVEVAAEGEPVKEEDVGVELGKADPTRLPTRN